MSMSSSPLNVLMDQHWPTKVFDAQCRQCSRLSDFHQANRTQYPTYFNAPVPPFGSPTAELLVVGLAPGLHGANQTGRPFTGDFCGQLLYQTIFEFGFSNCSESRHVHDGLQLNNLRVSNAVKCVPPQNKPLTEEIKLCNQFLAQELEVYRPKVVLALGVVAHQALLRAVNVPLSAYPFAHGAQHVLKPFILLDSYHVSRYNTQTGRLTSNMFQAVFKQIQQILQTGSSDDSIPR